MTKPRYDAQGTEFGLWLRKQKKISSDIGFITTDIDYIWGNYETGEWMIIEEKRHSGLLPFYQEELFNKIDKLCRVDRLYCGFHKVVFENTNPDDGKIWLDGKVVMKEELLKFLRFESYKS